MLKYAIVFVVSTGFLVYFVTPGSDDDAVVVATEQANTSIIEPTPIKKENSGWSYDAGEDVTFGEPVKYGDDESTDQKTSASDTVFSNSLTQTAPKPIYSQAPQIPQFTSSPKPGEYGSAENPVKMTPTGVRQ